MSKVQSDYILKQGGEIGQLKDEIKRLQAEIAELKALNVHKIIARQQKDLEQSRSDYLDLKEECKAMDTAMQQAQRERDALRDKLDGLIPRIERYMKACHQALFENPHAQGFGFQRSAAETVLGYVKEALAALEKNK